MSKIRTAFVLFLLSSTPLQAAAIDEAGALKLKDSLQKMLNYQKKVNETFAFDSELEVLYEGDLKVTPQTDVYAVEFPKISIKGKSDEGKEDTLELGVIKMNALPGDKDGEWTINTTLPQPLIFADGALEIGFGNQTIAGVYNDIYGLTKMNITFDNVTLKTEGKDSGLKIGSVQYVSDMNQEADNTFTGPSRFTLNNFDLTPPEQQSTVHLDQFKLDVDVKNLHIATINDMSKKLDDYAKVLEAAKNPDGTQTPEDMKKLTELVFDLYELQVKDFDSVYSVQNLKLVTEKPEANNVRSVALNTASLQIKGTGLQSESGEFGLKVNYDGLKLEPESIDTKIPPTAINIDLLTSKIPFTSATALGASTLDAIKTNPEMAAMAGMATLFKLPTLLAQAGTNLKISDSFVKGADYHATLSGDVTADITALTSFKAKLQGVFAGLDTLIELAKASNTYKDLEPTLSMIKDTGNKTEKDGMPAYSYDIEATTDGKFLINGKELAPPAPPADPAVTFEPPETLPQDAAPAAQQ